MEDDSVRDGVGEESGVFTADLLAACKNNDTKRAQDLLAKHVLPDYSEPESGERGQLLRAKMRLHFRKQSQRALGTLNKTSENMGGYGGYFRNSQASARDTLDTITETSKSAGRYHRDLLEDPELGTLVQNLGYSLDILDTLGTLGTLACWTR